MKKDNKREIAIFNQLKDRINEYLVQNEFIEAEYFIVTDIASGIFLTNVRALILKPANAIGGLGKPKVKKINIESIYYNNIETVSYNEGVLGYDTLNIKMQGLLRVQNLTISKDASKNLYNDLNQKLVLNTMSLESRVEISDYESLSKELNKTNQKEKDFKKTKQDEKKEIDKEKRKEATKKAANYLGEKTLQFGKWGAKQVKNKSEQIIHDMKEKKGNN